jgi:hypothetical protein
MLAVYSSIGWFVAGILLCVTAITLRRYAKIQASIATLKRKNQSLEDHFDLVNKRLKEAPTAVVPVPVVPVSEYAGPPLPAVTSNPGDIAVFTEVRHKPTGQVMTVMSFKNGKAECFWLTADGKGQQEYYPKTELENIIK